jgi:DNA-directed RNA polymerase subunit beta'
LIVLDATTFDELRIGLATADQIRMWSNGEIRKPETINYRTLRPERDGLFCEKIFGPTKDWECYCGKYKRVRFKGIICERCGVEVTRSRVRRERMGHIELAAPVTHIWYFKGVPSRLGYLLDLAPKELEKVIYFAAYMITSVDDEKRHKDLGKLAKDLDFEKNEIRSGLEKQVAAKQKALEKRLKELEKEGARASQVNAERNRGNKAIRELNMIAERRLLMLDEVYNLFTELTPKTLVDDHYYRELADRYGAYFEGAMGAEAIKRLLQDMDLKAEHESLKEIIRDGKGQKKQRAIKRLKVVNAFLNSRNAPEAMVLEAIPVIPPDLRPMVQLDGGRFATSDLNDLYRRVINRNNRLKRLLDLGAPEIIVNNEKRMLQEAVDHLFDNGRRGRPVTGPGNRPLKSLSDMLKGKQGRFRQNLLGKRVDYSGRSVIVVGPHLKLHQCGLPKLMALELFKPFVMKRLVDLGHAQNIKSAKRSVERQRAVVWDVLEQVIAEHPVLLNRAPTLHRLGIQAFEPILVEGKAIQIHPLVCTAFNADFDGDMMAVHVPLSPEAQAEARILMLSANNVLSPAHGRPIVTPTQDMVLGIYYLTLERDGMKGEGMTFGSLTEAKMAHDFGELHLHAKIKIRLPEKFVPWAQEEDEDGNIVAKPFETTLGRVLFNMALPEDHQFVNQVVAKRDLGNIVDEVIRDYDRIQVEEVLDAVKHLGFYYATRSGLTIGVEDVITPPNKAKILATHESEAQKMEDLFKKGIITDDERRSEVIEIWTRATSEVADDMKGAFDLTNPVAMMKDSGARGSDSQIQQISAMRGLVSNPKGDIIPRPIKSSFRDGLTVLEYFISTHGARKGLADTALRTADSGYLTRRLVDVSQDVIVLEEDCGSDRGIVVAVRRANPRTGQMEPDPHLDTRLYGRILVEDAVTADGEILLEAGTLILDDEKNDLVDADLVEVKVRSVLTCNTRHGVCSTCYGRHLATGRMIDVGEAVGIIAAQSIGEPGTQLTMRTFHTGGVAGDDITSGLPRVVELFEARSPKGEAIIAEISGTVKIEDTDKGRLLKVVGADGEEVETKIPTRTRMTRDIRDGVEVTVGQQLTEGNINPHKVLEVLGPRKVQEFLVDEIQKVYQGQGVQVHDKHIELIVRQMLRRVNIVESGDTEFLPGQFVERRTFEETNRATVEASGTPASARPQLMGITKASLATESWLSAASFQETTRVLTEAAISGRSDSLRGLKENVIIGKLIPAGTGQKRYRSVQVAVDPDQIPERMYAVNETFDGDDLSLLDAPMPPADFAIPPQIADELAMGAEEQKQDSTGTED